MKMAEKPPIPVPPSRSSPCENAPGIVIKDGGVGERAVQNGTRVRAFVYGEELPGTPTLPFGRWRVNG